MVERLLEDPEDVLHFDDKTLISNYRLLRNMILQLAHVLQPQPALRPFHTGRGKRWNRHVAVAFSRSGSVLCS